MRKIYTLFIALLGLLCSVDVMAQTWTWTGETPSAGDFYLYNVGQSQFMQINANGQPKVVDAIGDATMVTLTGTTGADIIYKNGNTTQYLYHNDTLI